MGCAQSLAFLVILALLAMASIPRGHGRQLLSGPPGSPGGFQPGVSSEDQAFDSTTTTDVAVSTKDLPMMRKLLQMVSLMDYETGPNVNTRSGFIPPPVPENPSASRRGRRQPGSSHGGGGDGDGPGSHSGERRP